MLTGIVQALKEVYPTLDDSSKDKIKKTIDNPNLNLNKLMKELGGVVDNLSTADQERIRELLTKAEEERRAVAYAIYENTNMTDEEKELFAGLVVSSFDRYNSNTAQLFQESLIDPKTSLVGQCNSAKGLAGSVRKEMLGGLGIPDSITTIDCSTLSKSLLAS